MKKELFHELVYITLLIIGALFFRFLVKNLSHEGFALSMPERCLFSFAFPVILAAAWAVLFFLYLKRKYETLKFLNLIITLVLTFFIFATMIIFSISTSKTYMCSIEYKDGTSRTMVFEDTILTNRRIIRKNKEILSLKEKDGKENEIE